MTYRQNNQQRTAHLTVAFLGALLSALFFGAFAIATVTNALEDTAKPASNSIYDGALEINTNTGMIKAKWTITLFDKTEQSLTFGLRSSLGNIRVEGPNVSDLNIGEIDRMGGLKTISFNLSEADADTAQTISISYDGILLPEPLENRINKVGPDYVELNVDSFWFPIDMRFNQTLTSKVDVRLEQSGWQGVTGGDVLVGDNGKQFTITNPLPALDISFTLAPNFVITEGDNFQIFDLRREALETDKVLTAADQCYRFLNSMFAGNNPLPPGRFVLHDRPSSGYSRYNYIALSSIVGNRQEQTTGFLCHELGHYWSRHGNFGTVENWLNESFSMTLELLAVRHYFGDEALSNRLSRLKERLEKTETVPSIWDGKNLNRRPYIVNYVKGPVVLFDLEQKIGQEAFMTLVKAYISEEISTTPDLIKLLERQTNKSTADWFKTVLAEAKTPS